MNTKVLNLSQMRKRKRIINRKECETELKGILPNMFRAYHDALSLFNTEVVYTPIDARPRAFEAQLFTAKLVQCLIVYFPECITRGKYGRIILRIVLNGSGYMILPKKLNSKDMPMNIKTKYSNSIYNQLEGNLFADENENGTEPILFFGYRKDKIGQYLDPKLVYVDENKVVFTIDENSIAIPQISELIPPMKPINHVRLKNRNSQERKAE